MKKLQLQKLTKSYTGTGRVVVDFSLQVEAGEFVSLIGPNGCGKSTILKMVAGIVDIDSGKVDKPKKISYVPQKSSLLPWRTVKENLLLERDLGKEISDKDIDFSLEKFGLSDFADMYPGQLSGGMQQKVSIIRSVISRPELLILDEPFAALDSITRRSMLLWLKTLLQDLDVMVLCVTHDITEAVALSDSIYVLSPSPGKIISNYSVTRKNRNSLEKILENELTYEVI